MTTPWATAEQEPPRSRRLPIAAAALAVGVLVLAAALAALGGWWWWRWWSPAPMGEIYKRQDLSYGWYANPLDPGQAHVAASTFEYIVAGFLLALVLGALAGLLGRNRALVALAAVLVGSALAAFVMWRVGTAMSPPDPSRWADAAHYGKHFPGALTVAGWPSYLVWPLGALLGFVAVMLFLSGDGRRDREDPGSETSGIPRA